MAGGERGVDRAAEILSREVARTMRLLGAARISDLSPELVRLPQQRLGAE
jgi:L-lactate dehydrogenase (cytochrome)